jgi:hypothetical protein
MRPVEITRFDAQPRRTRHSAQRSTDASCAEHDRHHSIELHSTTAQTIRGSARRQSRARDARNAGPLLARRRSAILVTIADSPASQNALLHDRRTPMLNKIFPRQSRLDHPDPEQRLLGVAELPAESDD